LEVNAIDVFDIGIDIFKLGLFPDIKNLGITNDVTTARIAKATSSSIKENARCTATFIKVFAIFVIPYFGSA
jgi:hypothetical protein